MSQRGISNLCKLLRRPRVALWLFRSQPGFLRDVLSGGLDAHIHD